ncbi:MAG: hypothetical protein IPQ07_44880 [Myxococcales bacterium]|nr:hypothetical protein [Myxococcales bacterium]
MTRLAIAFAPAAVVGCSGSAKPTTTSGGSGTPMLAKKVSVSGIPAAGRYGGPLPPDHGRDRCAGQPRARPMEKHLCGRHRGRRDERADRGGLPDRRHGRELQAVQHGGDEIIVMKLGIDEGVAPDPMAREEVKRIKVPLGAKIEAGS